MYTILRIVYNVHCSLTWIMYIVLYRNITNKQKWFSGTVIRVSGTRPVNSWLAFQCNVCLRNQSTVSHMICNSGDKNSSLWFYIRSKLKNLSCNSRKLGQHLSLRIYYSPFYLKNITFIFRAKINIAFCNIWWKWDILKQIWINDTFQTHCYWSEL